MKIFATKRYYDERKEHEVDYNVQKGIDGEYQVFYQLKQFYDKVPGFIIPNFKFKHHYDDKAEDDTVECDFIVVTQNSIIIIEVKNWDVPSEIVNYGQVNTSSGNRGNIDGQLERQKKLLEIQIKNNLDLNINIHCVWAHNNPDLIKDREKSDFEIIDYKTVPRFINKIIENNNDNKFSLSEIRNLENFFIEKTHNSYFSPDNSFGNVYYDFFSNDENREKFSFYEKSSLENIDLSTFNQYKYKLRRNKARETGCCIYIPKALEIEYANKKQIIDDRAFAVIYNLFIRGDKYFLPLDINDNKKFKMHYYILTTLLFIKNGYFTIENNNIQIPISCQTEKEFEYKEVLIRLIKMFLTVTDIKDYNLNYTGKYKILFDDDKLDDTNKNNKLIYITKVVELDIPRIIPIWESNSIKYTLENNDNFIKDVVKMLFANSEKNFVEFRQGQRECIYKVFESNNNQIIMLPTGQGKSLIFYLLIFLQPKAGIIIYPTDILIEDQIERLNEDFGISNINNFGNTKKFDKSHIQMLMPDNMLDQQVLIDLIDINKNISVSYLILDEVHCLSKFSHDFRPEYCLLYDKINYYLENISVKGFTATATWEILEDLMKQFNLTKKDIFSPKLSKGNVKHIVKNITKNLIIDNLNQDIKNIRKNYIDDKILVFTKNLDELRFIKNRLDNQDNITYIANNEDYHNYMINFQQKTKNNGNDVLISNYDMGIGIDMPEINSIIHVSQPLSIADLSQHIGRGGRADYSCISIVYYDSENSEYIDSVQFQNIEKLIEEIFEKIEQDRKHYTYAEILINSSIDIKNYKFVFFSLFQLGIICEWWRKNNKIYRLGINRENNLNFSLVKKYVLKNMSNEKSLINKIKESTNLIDLTIQYYKWFVEWNNSFKKNSYMSMKELLDQIYNEKLNDEEIQKRITSEIYYDNFEIETIETIKKMAFTEIIKFAIKKKEQLYNYRKYFNSTDTNIIFLSFLYDLINDEVDNDTIMKLDFILDSVTLNEKSLIMKSLLELNNSYNNEEILQSFYTKIYSKLDSYEKVRMYSLFNNHINEKYQYLLLFSIINDYLKEPKNGE